MYDNIFSTKPLSDDLVCCTMTYIAGSITPRPRHHRLFIPLSLIWKTAMTTPQELKAIVSEGLLSFPVTDFDQ
ncbi:MAG: hypothetical protein ACTHKN_26230, partial [Achromobacter mucicolens]